MPHFKGITMVFKVDRMDRIGPNRTQVDRINRIGLKWTEYGQCGLNGWN